MKHRLIAFAAASLLASAVRAEDAKPAAVVAPKPATNAAPAAVDSKFPDTKERNSYAIGVMIASDTKRNLQRAGYDVNNETVIKAFSEAFAGKPTQITPAEAQTVVRAYSAELRQKAEEKRKAEGEKNKKAGEEFLAANKTKEGVVTLPSGLQYKVIKQGDGPKPTTNDTVVTHYRGTLLDGTEFDSSYSRGEPAQFVVTRVIKGWTEALQLMPVGSKWQLFIPSEIAYGAAGSPPKIGPNSTLIFEIELISVKPTLSPQKPAQPVVTSDIIKVPSKAEMDKGAKIEVLKPADVEKLQKAEAEKKAAKE
jgi:FKBP-type peptidyl-prolyl cis-trans isomerase FklB